VIGVAVVTWWLTFYEARLTLLPTPSEATVTVDGNEQSAGQRLKLKPGPHRVVIRASGRVPLDQTIAVKSGQYLTVPVTLTVVPAAQRVVSDPTSALATEAATDRVVYLNRGRHQAEQLSLASESASPIPLTPAVLDAVDEWRWGPQFTLALERHGDRWLLYDLARTDLIHQATTPWPTGVGSVAWQPKPPDTATALIHAFTGTDGERTLIRTTPTHDTSERLVNFKDTDITPQTIEWVGTGTDLVLLDDHGRLHRIVLYTRTLTDIPIDGRVTDFTVSPDGQTVVAATDANQLIRIGIDGKQPQRLKVNQPLNQLTWSADSQSLWIVEPGSETPMQQLDLATGALTAYTVVLGDLGSIDSVVVNRSGDTLVIASTNGLFTVPIERTSYPPLLGK
jgi:hypothetical protein